MPKAKRAYSRLCLKLKVPLLASMLLEYGNEAGSLRIGTIIVLTSTGTYEDCIYTLCVEMLPKNESKPLFI